MKFRDITDYFLSKDIIDVHKEYKKTSPKTGDKIINGVDTFFHFIGRYAPLPLEIDAVRRIADGQYILGYLELFGAEYWRVENYFNVKEKEKGIETRKEDEELKNASNEIERELKKLNDNFSK